MSTKEEEGRRSVAADLGGESEAQACASCGKTGDRLKRCTGCRSVAYCDVHCQRSHRKVHKAECKRRATELKKETAAESTVSPHPADAKEEQSEGYTPPPRPECPICMLPLPLEDDGSEYQACCGKTICDGCLFDGVRVTIETGIESDKAREEISEEINGTPCPFCRQPAAQTAEVEFARLKKRVDLGDPEGMYNLAVSYLTGNMGKRDDRTALELLHRSAELGYPFAANKLGQLYMYGRGGVEQDTEKAQEYFEQAAREGHAAAHHYLGLQEGENGNYDDAFSHLRIAAFAGYLPSLDALKGGYRKGFVSKDDLAASLRAFQLAQDEMKSDARDTAARAGRKRTK